MKGLIFSIKRYSIHDGPGIRVTFFLKGCPLGCIWCHNPEGISAFPEKTIRTDRAGGKSFYVEEEVGKYYTVKEIIEILEKDRVFINQSGGGVTFSGGEPMLQPDFLLEALKECRNAGFHTTVDTSGYSSPDNYRAVIPYTDLFLFDLKHLDDNKHIEMTGVSNTTIIENFLLLTKLAGKVMVRIPVIPGMNNHIIDMKMMKDFIDSTNKEKISKINLLPYHKIGSSKYKKFNREWKMEGIDPPSGEEMRLLKDMFSETGIKVKIGG
ncbi:MAG TPA: glycyl-radical enzyme activating protein [Bacteroidales bacterium]|nr:glycyl-radical enzyme activating protein [Bacteroidales bacterium]